MKTQVPVLAHRSLSLSLEVARGWEASLGGTSGTFCSGKVGGSYIVEEGRQSPQSATWQRNCLKGSARPFIDGGWEWPIVFTRSVPGNKCPFLLAYCLWWSRHIPFIDTDGIMRSYQEGTSGSPLEVAASIWPVGWLSAEHRETSFKRTIGAWVCVACLLVDNLSGRTLIASCSEAVKRLEMPMTFDLESKWQGIMAFHMAACLHGLQSLCSLPPKKEDKKEKKMFEL